LRWGYVAAIVVSALGHAAFFFFVVAVLPAWFAPTPPPPSYTVKVVDSLPAGELGTHLPRLSQDQAQSKRAPRPLPPKAAATPLMSPSFAAISSAITEATAQK